MSDGDDAGRGQPARRGSTGGQMAAHRASRRRVGRASELAPEPLWVLATVLLGLTALAGGVVAVVFVALWCGLWWLVFGDEDLTRRRREGPREPSS